IAEADVLAIPSRDPKGATNHHADAQTIFMELDRKHTRALLTKAHRAYQTEMNDLLLAALGRAMRQCHGAGRGVVAMEGHGREALFEDIDISRTVGWFTSIYPVLIDMPPSDDPGVQIKRIKEGLRRIPNKGIGYGILKYLSPEAAGAQMPSGPRPRILLNYLGGFDDGARGGLRIDERTPANTVGGGFERESEIEIEGAVIGRRLKLGLSYNPKIHARETVDAFLQAYRDALLCLIDHCLACDAESSPLHEPTCRQLARPDLARILDACGMAGSDLQDIYPLSPLQEGMLYHTMLERGSSAYCMQIAFAIDGQLDPERFEACWNRLAARHDILRTVFTHKGVDRPLQIVSRRGSIDFAYKDISPMSAARQREYLARFRNRDLAQGFDPTARVPMRVRLFQKGERSFEAVWSCHHLLIDGWCAGILMSEFFEHYAALLQGGSPPAEPAPPYGDYIRWLEQLDRRATIEYWRTYLQGYDRPALLPRASSEEKTGTFDARTLALRIEPQTLVGLKRFAADRQVTLNTVVQTAWAMVLGRFSGVDDVVFGATVSGRPDQVPGIEAMTGLFINTVPVRIRIDPEVSVTRLVRRVQAQALQSQAHHYGALADIQAATTLKGALLDHALVFENYPLADELHGLESKYALGFHIKEIAVFEQTHYDLMIVVEPGTLMQVEFRYNATVFEERLMEQVRAAFGAIVEALAGGSNPSIGELRQLLLSTDEVNEQQAFIKSVQEISEDF
ncbi:MAG: condensation domain-containing protein, partial [Novosphingobium sp.]